MFGKKTKEEARMKKIESSSLSMSELTIIEDSLTGVQYLFVQGTNGVSVTPLIDQDGKPTTRK